MSISFIRSPEAALLCRRSQSGFALCGSVDLGKKYSHLSRQISDKFRFFQVNLKNNSIFSGKNFRRPFFGHLLLNFRFSHHFRTHIMLEYWISYNISQPLYDSPATPLPPDCHSQIWGLWPQTPRIYAYAICQSLWQMRKFVIYLALLCAIARVCPLSIRNHIAAAGHQQPTIHRWLHPLQKPSRLPSGRKSILSERWICLGLLLHGLPPEYCSS